MLDDIHFDVNNLIKVDDQKESVSDSKALNLKDMDMNSLYGYQRTSLKDSIITLDYDNCVESVLPHSFTVMKARPENANSDFTYDPTALVEVFTTNRLDEQMVDGVKLTQGTSIGYLPGKIEHDAMGGSYSVRTSQFEPIETAALAGYQAGYLSRTFMAERYGLNLATLEQGAFSEPQAIDFGDSSEYIDSIHSGTYTIVTGASGSGKSMVLSKLANDYVYANDTDALFFDLEGSSSNFLRNKHQADSDASVHYIVNPNTSTLESFVEELNDYLDINFVIQAKVVFVDNIDLLPSSKSDVARALNIVARKHNVAIIASQQARKMNSDASIGNHMTFDPSMYTASVVIDCGASKNHANTIDLCLIKSRYGKTGERFSYSIDSDSFLDYNPNAYAGSIQGVKNNWVDPSSITSGKASFNSDMAYNTDTNKINVFDGSKWVELGGVDNTKTIDYKSDLYSCGFGSFDAPISFSGHSITGLTQSNIGNDLTKGCYEHHLERGSLQDEMILKIAADISEEMDKAFLSLLNQDFKQETTSINHETVQHLVDNGGQLGIKDLYYVRSTPASKDVVEEAPHMSKLQQRMDSHYAAQCDDYSMDDVFGAVRLSDIQAIGRSLRQVTFTYTPVPMATHIDFSNDYETAKTLTSVDEYSARRK